MNFLRTKFSESPIFARVAPFVIFLVLSSLQNEMGETGRYWIYFLKTLVGAWLIWEMRRVVPEMKWAFSWEAVLLGVAVCGAWIVLGDVKYLHYTRSGLMWNPNSQFGDNTWHAWFFIVVRIVGSTLIVPPLEEVFYRSFLYRFLAQKNFLEMPLTEFRRPAFFIVAIIFGCSHFEWFAGILAGLAFQWLVLRKGRLGEAMTAHAIANFLLGLWVVWKAAWQFW